MSEPEASGPPDSFPSILGTGSMLKLAAELVKDMPARLGSYRILEPIGEGGMGVVYLAEQDPPLVRRVAIKLARSAVPGDRALVRFESERRTLAVMNHPNIARVFDAGSAPDARPFFVMEYVAGQAITDFCESRRLGIEARLELFLRVCEGVQHAHLNAIIHRDLKPANILVGTESGLPNPKIIDFGIAKALDDGAPATNGPTQFGQLVGTPEYMSPEQAALDGRPVDSRTDIYSLGVVLYELLVGGRPFERKTGPNSSFVELCRRVREEEPVRPSVRAPGALARRLRGDLDAIVMKALAKEPRSRYATPSDMAADIERHLHHRPIHARPPGLLVRLGKAFRRHRAATAIVAALSATLIAFAALGAVQALRARREAARAETQARIGDGIRRFVINLIDWNVAEGRFAPTAMNATRDREVLLGLIRNQFADQPVLQSQLLLAVGDRAAPAGGSGPDLATAVESRDRIVSILGPDSREALAANERLARTYVAVPGGFAEAERLLLDTLERRRRLGGDDDPRTWRTTQALAGVYEDFLKYDQAAPLFEAAIAGLERLLGPDDKDVLSYKVWLSGTYLELTRYADAQVLLEGSVDRVQRAFGEHEFQTLVALYNLACAHAMLGHKERALEYLGKSVALGWNYPFGPARDPQLLSLHGDPRFDEIDRAGRLNDRSVWEHQLQEARTSMREGRFSVAHRRLQELIAAVERVDRTGVEGWVAPRLALAECCIRQKRFDEAERLLLPILPAAQAEASGLLAQCDIGRGRLDAALERIATTESSLGAVYTNVELYYAKAQGQALRGRHDDALRSLAYASELGFADFERLEHDLAFTKLRARTEFQTVAKSARRRAL